MMQRSLKHRVLIFLAAWKRPEITELCFQGINRLKQHPDYEISALAVISEDSMAELCVKYNINHVFAPNTPLGKKKNVGLKACEQFSFDHIMEIGSDDLILNDLLDVYLNHLDKDFFGINHAAYIESDSGCCRRLESKVTYGAGRMISRKALEAVDFQLWAPGLGNGLDNHSVALLKRKGFKYIQIPTPYPMVIDVKSDENIWRFNHYLGVPYDVNNILEKLSDVERKSLVALWQTK